MGRCSSAQSIVVGDHTASEIKKEVMSWVCRLYQLLPRVVSISLELGCLAEGK